MALLAVLLAAGVGTGLAVATQPDDPPDSGPAAGPTPSSRTTGDVDGDGLGDLALSGVAETAAARTSTFTTWPGTGSGVGAPTEVTGIDARNVPVRGDFDGDGTEEYAGLGATTSGGLVVQPVDGGAPWLVGGAGFEVPPVVGDLDGDGTDDLALLGYPRGGGFDLPPLDGLGGGEIRLALGGERARTATVGLAGPFDPVADLLVAGDLDGDGDDDLTLLRPQGVRGGTPGALTLTPVLSDGGRLRLGAESAPQLRLAGTFARPVDVDGDGRDEVALVPSTAEEQVRTFGLTGADDPGTGTLTETPPWGTVGGATGRSTVRAVGVSDLDGDGRDDLALVRAVAGGGPVTGVDVMRAGTTTTTPFLALAERGLQTAKIADGSVSRPFGVDR